METDTYDVILNCSMPKADRQKFNSELTKTACSEQTVCIVDI